MTRKILMHFKDWINYNKGYVFFFAVILLLGIITLISNR